MRGLSLLGAVIGAAVAAWLLRRRGVALRPSARDPDEAALRELFVSACHDSGRGEALWTRHAESVLLALRSDGRPCDDLVAAMLAVADALGVPHDPGSDGGAATARLVQRLDERLRREGRAVAEKPLDAAAQRDFAAGIALHDEAVSASHAKLPQAHGYVLASLKHLEAALGKRDPLLVPSLANAARALSLKGERAAAEEALARAIELHAAQPGADEGEALRLRRLLDHVQSGA